MNCMQFHIQNWINVKEKMTNKPNLNGNKNKSNSFQNILAMNARKQKKKIIRLNHLQFKI